MFGIGSKKNRGFSLVEIVCAVAILGIISFSIIGFVSISTNSFRKSNVEVDLQYEAQQAANQIKELVVDTNGAVCFDATTNTFLVLNEKTEAGGTILFPAVKIWLDSTNNELLYSEHTPFSLAAIQSLSDVSELMSEPGFSSPAVLAKDITKFEIDDSLVDSDGKIRMSLEMTKESVSIESQPTVVLRNEVFTTSVSESIDDVIKLFDSSKVTKEYGRVKNIKILDKDDNPVTSVSVNKPDSFKFSAVVETVALSTDYEWKLTGNNSDATIISSDGLLTIDQYETARSLTLRATSVADKTRFAEVTISVPNKDKNRGYISSIEITQKELDHSGSGDNALERNYSFTVKVNTENEEKLDPNSPWFTYHLYDSDGTDISGRLKRKDGTNEFTLNCLKDDSGKEYTFVAEAAYPIDDISNTYANKSVKIEVGQIYLLADIAVTAEIYAAKDTIARGDNLPVGVTVKNLTDYTVKWELKYISGFNDEKEWQWKTPLRGDFVYKYPQKTSEKVSYDRSAAGDENYINVDKELQWDTNFEVELVAKIVDKDKNVQFTATKKFSIASLSNSFSINSGVTEIKRGEKISNISIDNLPDGASVTWKVTVTGLGSSESNLVKCATTGKSTYIDVDKFLPWDKDYDITLSATVKSGQNEIPITPKQYKINKVDTSTISVVVNKTKVSRGETLTESDFYVAGIPEYLSGYQVKWSVVEVSGFKLSNNNRKSSLIVFSGNSLTPGKSLDWDTAFSFKLKASIYDADYKKIMTEKESQTAIDIGKVAISKKITSEKSEIGRDKGSNVPFSIELTNIMLDKNDINYSLNLGDYYLKVDINIDNSNNQICLINGTMTVKNYLYNKPKLTLYFNDGKVQKDIQWNLKK